MLAPVTQPQPPTPFDQAFITDDEDALKLALVRHGQQAAPNVPNARTGAARPRDVFDAPLTELGREQARLAGERFAAEPVAAVYASPLRRAFDTGTAIARHHGIEPVVVDDLREVHLFRDMPPDRTAAEALGADYLKGVRARMTRERSWDVFPLSEPGDAFNKRVVNAIEGIIAEREGRPGMVVVACHGGVVNAWARHVIGAAPDMFFRPAHASVHLFAARDHWRALHGLNDVHHLRAAGREFVTF